MARLLVCVALVAAGLGSSFLALVFTGGDSAFGFEPRWVYWPWMAAIALTAAAVPALALAPGRGATWLAAAATLAYLGTAALWTAVLSGP